MGACTHQACTPIFVNACLNDVVYGKYRIKEYFSSAYIWSKGGWRSKARLRPCSRIDSSFSRCAPVATNLNFLGENVELDNVENIEIILIVVKSSNEYTTSR